MHRSNRGLSRISIKWLLPLLWCSPVLVMAAVLIMVAFNAGRRSADELTLQSMTQIQARIASHLTGLLDRAPVVNQLSKNQIDQGLMSLQDLDRNRMPVFQTLNAFPSVSSVLVSGRNKATMWIARYPGETAYEYAIKTDAAEHLQEFAIEPNGTLGTESVGSYYYEPTARPWYQAAAAAQGPTWGEVYVWVRHGRGETLGVPYVEALRDPTGSIQGVVTAELTLSDISGFLNRLRIGKTGKAFIIETTGNLIASSAGAATMKDDTERMPAVQSEDPAIAQAAGTLISKVGVLADLDGPLRLRTRIEGQPVQLMAAPYDHAEGLHWLVVTLVPEADFMGPVHAVRGQSLFFGGVILIVALLVGIAIAIWQAKPLVRLADHALKVGSGEAEDPIHLRGNREVAQLSDSMNQMAEGLKERLQLRNALKLAMDVQQQLLPSVEPKVIGVDVAAFAEYCDEVGGDYYDFLEIQGVSDRELVVALGDVMGHGVAAAMLMATARGIIRSHVTVQDSLGGLLTHVNQLLVEDTEGKRFMTMFLGVLNVESRTLRWSSAAHDPPIIYDAQTKGFVGADGENGFPLGVVPGEVYEEHVFNAVRPGQIYVIGTDGLWESMNEQDEQFGKPRVQAILVELADESAETIKHELFKRLKAFCGNRSIDDDVTYLVIKTTDASAALDAAAGLE